MRYLCAILALTLVSCGGAPNSTSVITTPAAQAQNLIITNPSAITGPLSMLQGTNGTVSLYIKHVFPNMPSPGQATVNFFINPALTAGQTLTISNSFIATAANNGSYQILSVDHGLLNAVINCSACVQYDDEDGQVGAIKPPNAFGCYIDPCTKASQGFPVLITSNNLLHFFYAWGTGSQGRNPVTQMWMTSTDGSTFTNPTALFEDSTTDCVNQDSTPGPCSYFSLSSGPTPNGNVVAFANRADLQVSANKGLFWRTYSNGSWSGQTRITDPAPDASPWCCMYGQIFVFGNMACSGQFMSNTFNIYFGCTCDNGLSWGQANCNGGFRLVSPKPQVNEATFFPGPGTQVVGISRTNATSTLTSCNVSAPCGTWQIYKSPDLGATWSESVGSAGAANQTTRWELVSPVIYCQNFTACVLFYGERDLAPTQKDNVLWASVNPAAVLYSDPTAIGVPQILASTNTQPTDCCYISVAPIPHTSKLLIAWYWNPFANKGWKLYYMTADLTPATGIAISHSQVIGTLR